MKSKKVGESDESLVPVSDFGTWLSTDINQKNLAMKPNKLSEKYEYQVQLTGYLAGFRETQGFSLVNIKVNVPPKAPSANRCRVVPSIGKPLSKIFKILFSKFFFKSLVYSNGPF